MIVSLLVVSVCINQVEALLLNLAFLRTNVYQHNGRRTFPSDTSPGRSLRMFPPLLFAYPDISPYVWCSFLPRVWRRRRHAGAARLRYRRGGDRQATDAASDLLQRLTPTAPLFCASRCVRCRRCSRCPHVAHVHPDFAASAAHHLCSTTWWLEDGGRDLACGRAHSPLRVKVTMTPCWLLHCFFFLDITLYNIISPYVSDI